MKVEIPWVRIGYRMPTNANEVYEGQPDTPYVPCLVFICYPGVPEGGCILETSFDTKKKLFVIDHYLLQDPYIITHFLETHHLTKPT